MKLLLLEDSATDAGLTMHAIKKGVPDCKIVHVPTLQEARGLLAKKHSFDLAVLDMQLPDGNGLDILFEIRQAEADIAVIMLTGSGDEEVAVAALKAGADDYMVKKPGYASKIPRAIEFAIENHKLFKQRELNKISVLYIEHNAADVDFTRRWLTRYAPYIRIENVPTGEEAFKILPENQESPEKWKYQVILIDYRLPGMNALEIIKEIRQERKLDIPIIIVTGHGNEEVAVQALKVGASEYLVKRENYLTRLPSLITSAFQYCMLERKQKELSRSEAKYRLLAENSGDVIFTLDFDLNFTYVSPAVVKLRGFSVDEVLQQNIAQTLTPDSLKKVKLLKEKMLPGALAGNQLIEPVVAELQTYKKDNTIIWVEVTATVLTNNKGNPVGILGVTRDISKRKAAQEELRKLSRAVTQSSVSISITDVNGNIEYVNPQFTKLTGYTFDEVIGRNPRLLKSGKHPDSFYKELWDTILAGKDWYAEIQNKMKNGELYWASASISPLVNVKGEITHFVAVKEDITEKKKMIQDLIVAKEKAEAANKLKTAFLNNISHEVRTPLNGILGFGQIMAESELSPNDKEMYLKILKKSSNRLIDTITSYMDISLIVSGNMEVTKKRFHLNFLLINLYEIFTDLFKEKGLDLILKEDKGDLNIEIESDEEILKKIFFHLLDNALKFTKKGYVEFGCKQKEGGVEFFVKDTGVGIDAEMQKSVFEYFVQEDTNTARGYEGSGLGLSISKGMIELLGGKIMLDSKKGRGTKVTFSIPLP